MLAPKLGASSWVVAVVAGQVLASVALDHFGLAGFPVQPFNLIRAAGLLVDTAGYPDVLARLEPATAPGATFRHTARELLALSAWRANDMTAARRWLDVIAIDNETPAGLRSRAEALQALLPPVAKS